METETPFHLSFEAIGTQWVIDSPGLPEKCDLVQLEQAIHQRIDAFDALYSRFRSDSLVAEMSRTSGRYELPADAPILFQLYKKLYDLSEGAFTPLVGSVLEQAGYDAEYSLQEKPEKTTTKSWEECLQLTDTDITLLMPALLDFGAGGKGYLVDLVVEILKEFGLEEFCVDAGGDMMYCTPTSSSIRVGLENPLHTGQVIGVLELHNASICSSAGNRRRWGEHHHIIDPHTQQSPKRIVGTWVTAQNALEADSLATALFLTSPEELEDHFLFEYLIMYDDSSVRKSRGFSGQLFMRERTQ